MAPIVVHLPGTARAWIAVCGSCLLVCARPAEGGGTSFGPQRVITTSADRAASVLAADLDGDSDLDVLSGDLSGFAVAWYENSDAAGDFGPPRPLLVSGAAAISVLAADLDGDGDLDVGSASFRGGEVLWFENNGTGSFGPRNVISSSGGEVLSIFAADLDGDGDLEILSAGTGTQLDDRLAWYENTDAKGSFGPQQLIAGPALFPSAVCAADLDGDGDCDVLSASRNDDKIAWYENTDGLGGFGPQRVITTSADFAFAVLASDLDGDGDLDVLSASIGDDKIAWYENTDGAGNFGPQRVITSSADGAISLFAVDLDGDSDLDVLCASRFDNVIAWYENTDGAGNFGPRQTISTSAESPFSVSAADLDGDGDLDVLSASSNDGKIAWYENLFSPNVALYWRRYE